MSHESPLPGSISLSTPIESVVQIAIETTGTSGSIAILTGEQVIRAILLPEGHRTASTLAPALSELLSECQASGLKPGFVSVASGPGSFTGLRIGITTAKTFCYARQIPLVAVDSLAAVAANVMQESRMLQEGRALQEEQGECKVLVGLNAYRRQSFAAEFCWADLLKDLSAEVTFDMSSATTLMDEADWLARLAKTPPEVLLAGDPKVFGDLAETNRFRRRETADAVGVGLLGIRQAKAGVFVDPMALTPRYLKASAAEEKWAK